MRGALLWVLVAATACGGESGEPGDDDAPDGGDAGPAETPGDAVATPFTPLESGLRARLGEGSLVLEVAGEGASASGGTLTVDLLDAQDRVLTTLEGSPDLWPIPDPWRLSFWWPTALRPASVHARVLDGDRVLLDARAPVGSVPVASGPCDPRGVRDRCGTGAICVVDVDEGEPLSGGVGRGARAYSPGSSGQCRPATVDLWLQADRVVVDVRASATGGAVGRTGDLSVGQGARFDTLAQFVSSDADGWRAHGELFLPVDDAVDVFVGPHRFQSQVPVRSPVERVVGERCDGLRYADRCPTGAACLDEACAPIHPPRLDGVSAHRDPETVGVVLDGFDPDRDVEWVELSWLDADGTTLRVHDDWFRYPVRGATSGSHGALRFEPDGRLAALWVTRGDEALRGARAVRAVLIDSEDQRSDPVMDWLGAPAPTPAPAGAPCDDYGLLTTCAPGTFCDLPDGQATFACQTPHAECGEGAPVEPLDADALAADNGGAPDVTLTSCLRTRGNLGQDDRLEFTATGSGVHRFVALEPDYGALGALAVRRYCGLPRPGDSELACDGEPDDLGRLSVSVELAAGETVYLIVESQWTGGGAYRLQVERPE